MAAINLSHRLSVLLVFLAMIPCTGKGSSLLNLKPESGSIKGVVRAVLGGQSTTIAGALLRLVNNAASAAELKTKSGADGSFVFNNLPAGDYTLSVEATGLNPVSRGIHLAAGANLDVDVDLSATISESVTIHEEEGLLSTSETSTSNVIRAETLKSVPLRTENFQNSIALTPGVVQDANGNDYLKGTRAGQSGYTVNGADVTDPATGKLAFDIPLEAAGTVEVEENPYSPEFGRFTGGVTNLQTKGGTEKFKVSGARFFPTFRNIFSTTVDSFRPRLTFSGPLIKDRIFFLQSFEYRFTRSFVPSQPKPANSITSEGFSSFTQLDFTVNKHNTARFNAAIFPNKIRNLGLDTFNAESATPNYKQRGFLLSVNDQAVFQNTSFLSSNISYKRFDVDVFGKSTQPFVVSPQSNQGGFFADTRRRSNRLQIQETYYHRQVNLFGQHSAKVGLEFDRTQIRGQLRFNSIFIKRLNGTLTERIDFTTASPLRLAYTEASAFATDRWVINPKFTVEYGARYDYDGITHNSNLAPRVSFLFSPQKNNSTVIRGGVGLFFDRSLSSTGYFDPDTEIDGAVSQTEFDQVPERIVTDYAANGTTILVGPRHFENRVVGELRTPHSVRWSIELDRTLTQSLTARIGLLQRTTRNDLIVEPIDTTSDSALLLSSSGRSKYSEFQFLINYRAAKYGQWFASYVFSRARGDLNTADRFLGDVPSFVVRANDYGRLPFDVPHRLLLYGQIEVSKKHDIRVAPVFEIRSGFPFSAVNERLDFVGKRNAAGRFPIYLSLDLQATKGFKLPFFKDKRARIGAAFFNLTNHFNPRDVQNNIGSPNYGQFYNSLGLAVKAKFDLEF